MSIYKDFLNSAEMRSSDSEFADKVIRAARRKTSQKPPLRRIISVSAAAAAVMTLAVTVSAVSGWNITEAVRAFFGDKGSTAEKSIVDISVSDEANTFEDLDISVSGAVRDENFTVIFLDIERKDGGVIDCAPYILKDTDGNDIILSDGGNTSEKPVYELGVMRIKAEYLNEQGELYGITDNAHCSQSFVNDGNDLDGHITMALCIDSSDPFHTGSAEEALVCSKVNISFDNFAGKKCTGKYSDNGKYVFLDPYRIIDMKGSFSCGIDLGNCDTKSRSIAAGGKASVMCFSQATDPDDMKRRSFDFELKSLNVTPVSVNIRLEREVPDETFYVERMDFGSVIMNDGRKIDFGGYTLPALTKEKGNIRSVPADKAGDIWTYSADFILPETIDINEVRAVIIGETEFTAD